jgi:hypothetical protein
LVVGSAVAQAPPPPDANAAPAPAPQPLLSPEQLDDLVAPIALYPDPLVSQVLVACTYPLEVVEAQQWLQQNHGLSGQQLIDAARSQNWDASVQALVAFPDVLSKLNQDVRWTESLGNAFLAQQADVMTAIQTMRQRAEANGHLNSTPQETVTTAVQGGQPVIQIEPANPQVIYVPSYDPMYVWGPPVWGAYPYLYYPTFGFGFGPGIDIALCFGGWGGYGWGGWGAWGWSPNWYGRTVFVNHGFFNRYGFRGGYFGGRYNSGMSIWAHNPSHRWGVPYPNRQLTTRYGAASLASRGNMRAFNGRSAYGGGFRGSPSVGRANAPGFSGGNSFRGGAGSGSRYSAPGGNYGGRSFGSGTYGGSARSFSGRSYSSPSFGGSARSFSSSPAYSSPRSFGGARSFSGGSAPSFSSPRSFSGASPRSFSGGGFSHSFGGGSTRSFSAPRSFGGGGFSHSFSGGGGHSFGGGSRSFGGGGGHSFGGGGHASGGGGHSSGGGHGGRR